MITRVSNHFTDSPHRVHTDAGAREIGFPRALVPGIVTYGMLEAARSAVHRARFLKPIYDGDLVTLAPDRAVGEDGEVRILIEPICAIAWSPEGGEALRPIERSLADPLSRGVSIAGAVLDLAHQILMANFDWAPWLHVASEVENYASASEKALYRVSGRITWPRPGRALAWIEIANADALVQRVVHRVKLSSV